MNFIETFYTLNNYWSSFLKDIKSKFEQLSTIECSTEQISDLHQKSATTAAKLYKIEQAMSDIFDAHP